MICEIILYGGNCGDYYIRSLLYELTLDKKNSQNQGTLDSCFVLARDSLTSR